MAAKKSTTLSYFLLWLRFWTKYDHRYNIDQEAGHHLHNWASEIELSKLKKNTKRKEEEGRKEENDEGFARQNLYLISTATNWSSIEQLVENLWKTESSRPLFLLVV